MKRLICSNVYDDWFTTQMFPEFSTGNIIKNYLCVCGKPILIYWINCLLNACILNNAPAHAPNYW